jgi:YaiO family outer membrane protein
MKKRNCYLGFLILIFSSIYSQKIDTDSLLVVATKQINSGENYPKAIQLCQLGIRKAPTYLDFHVAIGRVYKITNQQDSARYYFNYVIEKNPVYKDAFLNLINLEIEQKNIQNANNAMNKALELYPEDQNFNYQKLRVVGLENNDAKSIEYLKKLISKYPNDASLKLELIGIKTRSSSDRIGLSINNTSFSRNEIEPYQIMSFQYIRERKKITIIGKLNYFNRNNPENISNNGLQYEFESYFVNNKHSYSYANISVSNDLVFPKLRLNYSYFHNISKGLEGDIGVRYTKANNKDFYAGVIGLGKYFGSYWVNLKSNLQFDENKIYPSFTAITRYYFDTKYDYASLIVGFGKSPDEKIDLGLFQDRITLNSFRIGAGFFKLISKHYCLGLQTVLNNQEYKQNSFQNEIDVFVSAQYKF